MRWHIKERKISNYKDIRCIKKFLWFPRRIGDECRWLEKVYIKQRFILAFGAGSSSGWEDVRFVNRKVKTIKS